MNSTRPTRPPETALVHGLGLRPSITKKIEIDQSPIPIYKEHKIIEKLQVTKVVSVGLFYGRPLSRVNRANLKLVQMKLAECQSKRLSSETPKELQLVVGKMYGCLARRQTQLDDLRPVNHYRCHLIRINSPCKTDEVGPGYVKVCLIDYGDQQVVDIRNVFNITKELEEHPTVCRLFKMSGVILDPDFYSDETVEWFQTDITRQTVTIAPVLDNTIYPSHEGQQKPKGWLGIEMLDYRSLPKMLVYTKAGLFLNDELRVQQVSQTKHVILKKLREMETQNQDKETLQGEAAPATPQPTRETGAPKQLVLDTSKHLSFCYRKQSNNVSV